MDGGIEMGFRYYIGKVSKKDNLNMKSLSYFKKYDNDLNEYCFSHPSQIAEYLYELGKYFSIKEIETHEFFEDKKTHEHYNDDWLFVKTTKEGFAQIIEKYRKNTEKYYKNLYEDINSTPPKTKKIKVHIASILNEWRRGIIDISNNNPQITKSWKYEYAIFELIRLYKTFDWENDIAVIYGC